MCTEREKIAIKLFNEALEISKRQTVMKKEERYAKITSKMEKAAVLGHEKAKKYMEIFEDTLIYDLQTMNEHNLLSSNDPFQENMLSGIDYFYGISGGVNYKNAIKHFKAEMEYNALANYYLAICYLHGLGVSSDFSKALDYLEEAMEREYIPAIILYCKIMFEEEHNHYTNFIIDDCTEKLKELEDKKISIVSKLLGDTYKKREDEAFIEYYEKASYLGNYAADCVLGEHYYEDLDYESSKRYFERALKEFPVTEACLGLFNLYMLQHEEKTAKEYMLKATISIPCSSKHYDKGELIKKYNYISKFNLEDDYETTLTIQKSLLKKFELRLLECEDELMIVCKSRKGPFKQVAMSLLNEKEDILLTIDLIKKKIENSK